MKRLTLVALCLALGCSSSSTPRSHHTPIAAPSSHTDLGTLHHPVTTNSPDAQKAFDEGLTLVYAFNHDEAINSFKRALTHDPNLAMAHWGIALALGPNYNIDVDTQREKMAYDEIQKAIALSNSASQPDKDFIAALAKRYSNAEKPDLPKLAVAYKNAMKELVAKYPDDLDAATLYADSMMVLKPWQLWSHDGKPAEGTLELVATLESVLRRNPDHVGANHLYIHAVEASPNPERALESANRLPGLAPAAGHIVHMPSHIYARVGDHEAASGSNAAAVEADQIYLKATNAQGVYSMMYYSHNIHFLAYADAARGRYNDAIKAANDLANHVGPHVKHMPMLEGFMTMPPVMLVTAHRWNDILAAPEPDASMPITTAMWHYARAMAASATNKPDEAQSHRSAFLASVKALPSDAMYGPLNKASDVFTIAQHSLDGQIAEAKNDHSAAIKHLRSAVEVEDKLNYTEPPDWYPHVRPTLGAILLKSGNAAEAEKVFRKDLDKNPRHGRSLFGLMESLKAQGKNESAKLVEPQYQEAWKNADKPLTIDQL